MAAGLGFKDFVTGEVLTAADVDGYLMQGVWVFASAAARDAAVTSPQEGNFAYLKDTNVTTYYTGSAWANLDTTGMTNPMTTTGDTIYSSSGSTPARLGIGSTGQVLTVAGGVPSWSTPAGGSGLTLITTQGFSGSSSQSISDCFSSTYTNYRIMFYLTDASAQTNILARLRVSGSDASGSNYNRAGYLDYGAGIQADHATGETSWPFSGANKDSDGLCTEAVCADIFRPFLAKKTAVNALGVQNLDTGRGRNMTHTLDTSYTGITFFPATGTMTGSVSIYGYSI